MSIDLSRLLHECMKKYPTVAHSLMESIMSTIEEGETNLSNFSWQYVCLLDVVVREDSAFRADPERDNHLLGIFANLLFAYDGLSEKVIGYLDRLQAIAQNCNSTYVIKTAHIFHYSLTLGHLNYARRYTLTWSDPSFSSMTL